MLLVVIAGFFLALGLQLRARPFERDAGYYLAADGVVALTSWKVIERSPPRRPAPTARPAPLPGSPTGSPVRPWGEPEPAPSFARVALRLGRPPSAPAPAPVEPVVARLEVARGAPPPAPERIVIPAEVLAEIDAGRPTPWSRPLEPEPVHEFVELPPDPAFAWFVEAPAGSLALH